MSVQVPVYILAGGRSSRFGSDKARAALHGRPMIVRIAELLRPVAESMIVVAEQSDKYADLGLLTIADAIPGQGPLGGLVRALEHRHDHAGPGWLLLSSCDWAEIKTSWAEALCSHAHRQLDAVAFRDDRWQPLFALYHTRAIPSLNARLAQGRGGIAAFLDACASQAVAVPGDWSMALQINTPADRDRYLRFRAGSGDVADSSTAGLPAL